MSETYELEKPQFPYCDSVNIGSGYCGYFTVNVFFLHVFIHLFELWKDMSHNEVLPKQSWLKKGK